MQSNYLLELDALQRWIWETVGLQSMRLMDAPPKVSRPMLLWETPNRQRDRRIGPYTYFVRVIQYGKLYVTSLDQLLDVQDKLFGDLENGDRAQGRAPNTLPVFWDGKRVAWLTNVGIEFQNADSLDTPVVIRYESAYSRTRPEPAPQATKVTTKSVYQGLQ